MSVPYLVVMHSVHFLVSATLLLLTSNSCSSDGGVEDKGGADGSASGGSPVSSAGGASSGGMSGGEVTYGQKYEGGQFNLGPVDFTETEWHNACAPSTKYAPAVQQAEGQLLAGLWNGIPNVSGYCDACISVTTAKGKSAILRVVTYGDTTKNSIDVSPAAYQILNGGEYPRSMTWQFGVPGHRQDRVRVPDGLE